MLYKILSIITVNDGNLHPVTLNLFFICVFAMKFHANKNIGHLELNCLLNL